MVDDSFLAWPFFDDEHRNAARSLEHWLPKALPSLLEGVLGESDDVYASVTRLVRGLGQAGWLRACVPAAYGGSRDKLDVRSLCIEREILARTSAIADFAFAMQGLGSVPVSLFGHDQQKKSILPGIVAGTVIGAFALSEPNAGSDVAAIATTATRDGDGWVLDGTKTWISNAGLADYYIVFARTGEALGTKGLSAFIVDSDAPGLDATERIEVMAPHPLGTLRFSGCRVGDDQMLGHSGDGFKIAMTTLDIFRATVGAAGLGLARRAFDEATMWAMKRHLFGRALSDFQLTQAKLADMAVAIDASALLVYRAAWTKDVLGKRVTRESSIAKLFATESAQKVIDEAVQIHGGVGVVRGSTVERLYREIRALRIYEGASEVLKLVIGSNVVTSANRSGSSHP